MTGGGKHLPILRSCFTEWFQFAHVEQRRRRKEYKIAKIVFSKGERLTVGSTQPRQMIFRAWAGITSGIAFAHLLREGCLETMSRFSPSTAASTLPLVLHE